MADDDALNRAKRALVPRDNSNDALSRAKRALARDDNGANVLERARAAAQSDPLPAVIGKDTGRLGDLLTRARTLSKSVEVKPPPAPEPVPVREEPFITPPPLREAPLAPIAVEPAPVPAPARRPAEVLPAEAPVQHVTVQQTVIVQAPPAYPYPYPYPYWPLWAGCARWNCPLRAGLPCTRSWLTCGRW